MQAENSNALDLALEELYLGLDVDNNGEFPRQWMDD
jgi:hypothetical protein